MAWLALLLCLAAITAAQELFYETHRRRYGMWRSTRERRFWMSREERSLAFDALVHRNADARVESTRLIAITVFVLVLGAMGVLWLR
jgi:hypothetical protein